MRRRRWIWAEAALTLLAGMVSVGTAAWALGVGRGDFPIPWSEGDMLTMYSLAENVSRGNWFLHNPDLGYPAFQDHGHFPFPDLASMAQVAVLAQLSDTPMGAVNVFAMGTFFTVAAAFYAAARMERVFRPAAFILAIAFSVLPWHLIRAGLAAHPFLASYMSVPLSIMLFSVAARRTLDRSPSVWMLVLMASAAILVGCNGVYYAFLATAILAVILTLGLFREGFSLPGWRTLLVSGLVPATTAVAIAVNLVSVSTASIGESVVRSPMEAYIYGGNIATLFFPSSWTATGEWIGRAIDLDFQYNPTIEGDALLSSAGVLAVLITCWMAAFRWTTLKQPATGSATARASFWPGVFILVIAFFAMSGLGALFTQWVSGDIRAWGRFSIYALGIAFLVTGLVLTALHSSSRRGARVTSWVILSVLGSAAVLDLSSGRFHLDLTPYESRDLELRQYAASIEERTASDCAVLELPLVEYPEMPPVNAMSPYSHLWTYLYSSDLRWSYGAIKGTAEGSWGLDVRDDPAALFERAKDAGFCGMQFDTLALANPTELVDELAAFGEPDLVSASGRWLYFDLTGPEPGEYVVAPVSGFAVGSDAGSPSTVPWWMVQSAGELQVSGEPSSSVDVVLGLVSPPCSKALLTIDGEQTTVVGAQEVTHSVDLDAEGKAILKIEARSPQCTIEAVPQPVYVGLKGPTW